jgi:hypothetical protein
MASVLPSLGYEDRGLNDNIAYEALDGTTLSEVRLTAIALKQRKARILGIHLHGH